MSIILISCQNKSIENKNIDNETSEKVVIEEVDTKHNETGKIYLYGEFHGQKKVLDEELELWQNYYHEEGMRHLFLEDPYFKAQLLNIWMQEDSDEILEEIIGSNFDLDAVHNFFRAIKETCPDTVFHGVDVSGYKSTHAGYVYRDYLEANNLSDSELYKLNEKAIEDVIHYTKTSDGAFREQRMYENFIREFNQLNESVMAIFGNGHISYDQVTTEGLTYTSLAKLLSDHFDDRVLRTDLSYALLTDLLKEAISYDEMTIGDKTYQVAFYGRNEFTGSDMILSYDYYRVIDAFEDFKDNHQLDTVIYPYHYPMKLSDQEVYLTVAHLKDQTTMNYYAITNGFYEKGHLISCLIRIQ
jgi:hypothetical protein